MGSVGGQEEGAGGALRLGARCPHLQHQRGLQRHLGEYQVPDKVSKYKVCAGGGMRTRDTVHGFYLWFGSLCAGRLLPDTST